MVWIGILASMFLLVSMMLVIIVYGKRDEGTPAVSSHSTQEALATDDVVLEGLTAESIYEGSSTEEQELQTVG